ncbi:MAG: hypothetical protein QNJ97_21300 [Myxococcota bacterium]|nr:hypothetical protein [Myxococcota bacterium]
MSEKETRLFVPSTDGVELEGRLITADGDKGAVICHPHPLYGGTMDNGVVLAARDVANDCGIQTLRFNFRGVGTSSGAFSGGEGEARDVIAATQYLRALEGISTVYVVAYSFGSWALLLAQQQALDVPEVVLIAPPVSFIDFSELSVTASRITVVFGEEDVYCREPDLDTWLSNQDTDQIEVQVTRLPGVDHFFTGADAPLKHAIKAFFAKAK